MNSPLEISELSYLKDCSDAQCKGGYADADAYTAAGPGYAEAAAIALAAGEAATAKTRTKTVVRVTRNYIFSRAWAVGKAVAVTDSGIERDFDRSFSKYKYPIRP